MAEELRSEQQQLLDRVRPYGDIFLRFRESGRGWADDCGQLVGQQTIIEALGCQEIPQGLFQGTAECMQLLWAGRCSDPGEELLKLREQWLDTCQETGDKRSWIVVDPTLLWGGLVDSVDVPLTRQRWLTLGWCLPLRRPVGTRAVVACVVVAATATGSRAPTATARATGYPTAAT